MIISDILINNYNLHLSVKLGLKLTIPILIFIMIFSIFTIYIITELKHIASINIELMEAEKISKFALDFNVENFHTQLEIWEYVYEPNQKRLDAFESHKVTMDNLLKKLNRAIDDEYNSVAELHFSVYPNATQDIIEINQNLLLIQADWALLLDAIDNSRNARETGVSNEGLKRFDSIVYKHVIQNEDLFDTLEFNKKIDIFVSSQKILIDNLTMEREKIYFIFMNTLYGMFLIVILLSIVIYILVSKKIVNPIKNLKHMTKEISKGNLDVRITVNGNDEITELSSDINIMAHSLLRQKDELRKKEKIETIGLMSSTLSHNLRNPLTAIKGMSDMLKYTLKEKLDESSLKRFSVIDDSITNMVDQIEGVLAYIQNKPLNIKPHSILKIFESVNQKLIIPSGITLTLPQNDVEINCDAEKIKVVFSNIIYNAIQSIKEKGRIKIRVKTVNEKVVIEIENSGPEIDEKVISEIFKPLFTTKNFGTGLGLFACKRIMEQHDGTISVKNSPTTFVVTLPRNLISVTLNS